jgi:two-component system LytT family sensor kinase
MLNRPPSLKRWLLRVGFCFALCTALALSESVSSYFSLMKMGRAIPWSQCLRQPFKMWYAFGLFSFGIVWLCNRIRLEAGQVRRWIAKHLAASLAFSLVFVTFVAWLIAGERSVYDGSVLKFSYLLTKFAIGDTVWFLMLYWVVVLGHLGWTSYHASVERERQAATLATELVQARLQALRMQINPHFFFNTLNTISALIHDDPHAADRMVARLSELLRRTLDRADTQEVPLREELDFLRRYLEIEQTRFGERLTVNIQVEPGTEDLLVPFLLLQPLVENAIRHGIEPREEPGHVEIRARRDGGRLELRVKDNGDGLPAEPAREGIGLTNTRSRLMHLYDEEASFELTNLPGGGLEVRIRLPARATAEPFRPKVIIMSRRDLPEGVLPRSP